MMQRYALSFALFPSLTLIVAQPTLIAGSVNPVPGDALTYSSADFVEPGIPGAGVTWDFAALSTIGSNTFTYVTPGSTGLSTTFPDATVAQDEGGGAYFFYRADATGYKDFGFTLSGYTCVCSDPLLMLAYPMAFNGTFTDNMNCNATDGTNTWTRTATISGTADAHGNLVLPFGQVNNVLRVHTVQDMVDNQLDPPSTVHTDLYSWYRPGTHGPLFSVTTIHALYAGFPLNDSSSTVIDASSIVSVEELVRHDIGVELWPNPATDRLDVVYDLDGGHALTIDLLDVTGQVLRHLARRSLSAGMQREVLPIAELPAGAYLVRITDDTGALGMQRVVKH